MYERFDKKGDRSKMDVRPGEGKNMFSDMNSAAPALGGGPDGYQRISAKTYRKTVLPDQGTGKTDMDNQPGGVGLNGTRQPTSTRAEKENMDGMYPMNSRSMY